MDDQLTLPLDYASKNFKWSELECKCGCNTNYVSGRAIDTLQKLRNLMGLALTINSAARCIQHNVTVGGAEYSNHLSYADVFGLKHPSTAFDINTIGINQSKLIRKARQAGFNGIIRYTTFVHIDLREKKYEKV